jgi:hypothetical protein
VQKLDEKHIGAGCALQKLDEKLFGAGCVLESNWQSK